MYVMTLQPSGQLQASKIQGDEKTTNQENSKSRMKTKNRNLFIYLLFKL
jgi:hypothetical protein